MSKVPSPPNGLTDDAPFPPDCSRRFVYTRKLGAGGFGSVFQAHDRNRGAPAAVKLLFADLLKDTEQVRRFCDEARITGALSHPHVVRVLDFGAEFGVPWIAFEYIRGESVRAKLDAGAVPLAEALKIVSQVGQALAAAHAQGILHRDVKPDNVLQTETNEYKITDFGIAKWGGTRAVKTATGMILGTPQYVAPELVQGSEPSPASDIYALGVMLYELVAGVPPYADPNLGLLLERHLRDPIPKVSKPGVPEALDVVLASALAKSPRDRYQSVDALVAAVEALRTPEATPVREVPPRGSATRMIRPSGRTVAKAASRPVLVPPGATPPAAPRRWLPAVAAVVVLLAVAGGFRMSTSPTPAPSAAPAARETAGPLEVRADLCDPYRDLDVIAGQLEKTAHRKLNTGVLDLPAAQGLAEPHVAEVGLLLERMHAIVRPLVAQRGKDPQLLMFMGQLAEAARDANHLVQLLSPLDALSGSRVAKPHPISAALAKLQATLGVAGAGDYVYPLRCLVDGPLAITARTAWGRSRFFTDSDVLRATALSEQAVAQIAVRHQRDAEPLELLARIYCLDRTATVLGDMGTADGQAKARSIRRTIFRLGEQIETVEKTLSPRSRTAYSRWLATRMGEAALATQLQAAVLEASDTASLQSERLRAVEAALALVDGRGFHPDFTWRTAGQPAQATAIDRLTRLRDLPLTATQSARLARLHEVCVVVGAYTDVTTLPGDPRSRAEAVRSRHRDLAHLEKHAVPGSYPARMREELRAIEAAGRTDRAR